MSVLKKDEPFLGIDLTDEEILALREYRQNLPLDPELAKYNMQAYEVYCLFKNGYKTPRVDDPSRN